MTFICSRGPIKSFTAKAPNSKKFKPRKNLCSNCNNHRTQQANNGFIMLHDHLKLKMVKFCNSNRETLESDKKVIKTDLKYSTWKQKLK